MTLPTQEELDFTGPPLLGPDGLTEILNKLKSLVAHRSGTSRPADIQGNELWCDTKTATAQALKIYDGAQDITIGTFNSTTHTWTVAGALLLSLFTAKNDFIIANGAGTAIKKTLAQIKALLAGTSAGDLMAYNADTLFANTSDVLTAGFLQAASTITDGATPTINLNLSNHFLWVLGANRAFPNVTPSAAGRWLFQISGDYTLSFNGAYTVYGDTYDGSGTNSNLVLYVFDGTNKKMYVKSIAVAA